MLVKFEVVTRTKIKLPISDLSQRAVDSPLNLAKSKQINETFLNQRSQILFLLHEQQVYQFSTFKALSFGANAGR